MFYWLDMQKGDDFNKIAKFISLHYAPLEVARTLLQGVTGEVQGVLIETNYIDKDYRSTFYNFYSKKGAQYSSKCVRLHFFKKSIKFDENSMDFKIDEKEKAVQDYYLGFIVLRPTGNVTFGRSVICPTIRNGATGWFITSVHKVHVLGHILEIRGFPWMNQHSDISVCAHSACWAILRHYSERYSKYAEFLTHDITLMSKNSDPGGLSPSNGLSLGDAEKIFYHAGTYPILVTKMGKGLADASFYRQLACYLDSGIPVFGFMHDIAHAIAVVGFKLKNEIAAAHSVQFAWENVESLICVDDNFLPYKLISNSESPANADGTNYTAANIDAFIVPLPEKIYYPASKVDNFSVEFLALCPLKIPPEEDCVIRYFVTTSAAYQRFVREHIEEFDPVLARAILIWPMAQFIWVVEYATLSQWNKLQVSTRVVLDATASPVDNDMFWMYFNAEEAYLYDRSALNQPPKILGLQPAKLPYTRMQSNLHTF